MRHFPLFHTCALQKYHDINTVKHRCFHLSIWILSVCLQSLDKALKSALRSDLEDVSLALLMTPPQFDAYLLRKATKVGILCILSHVSLLFL